ncbi:hypothetical protein ACGEN4_06665 [Limosilactobacillus mucosae]|uniref:Uncharacterized protein n=2 Tax=Limosilactobacillus mucosae TaxID=97478 RepID=A0A0R1P329_LIMMU|nr:hypothetical protein [Limosilactobacillus mucosae]KRL26425.1 hypothetical protein FC47_GL001693 [Limosilactobacillus mucosae DSM 13345]QOL69661.1 hypothetical protein LM011_09895 [Limosilactobacillus mucosae]
MDFKEEMDAYSQGLRRTLLLSPLGIDISDEAKELAKDIANLCRESGLDYVEIQKAIIHADNSLYYHAKP